MDKKHEAKHKITDQTLADESLMQKAAAWNLGQWTAHCHLLSQSQLWLLIPLATPLSSDRNWKEKLHQLFLHLTSRDSAEVFGKALNATQLIEIIHFIKNARIIKNAQNDSGNREKLSSLFIGISPLVFKDVIALASEDTLYFLREEAMTEALQHNLSLITHELNTRFNDFCHALSDKENALKNTVLQDLDKDEILSLYRSCERFHEEGTFILNLTGKVLGIAWNTNRGDLIQELGRIKELCQKTLIESVGKEENHDILASGLWLVLRQKIDKLFSDQEINGIESPMNDSTPALEALIKFSIWDIDDYYALGLLPQAKGWNPLNREATVQEDEVDLNLNNYSSTDHVNLSSSTAVSRLKNREQLFIDAGNNLTKIGLKTLADLKAAKIYSKKALMEYINAHQRELFL